MAVQITTEQAYAYAELLEILSFMDPKLVEKIPNKLINIFKENALPEYVNHLSKDIPIEKQNISKKTASLLVLMKLNFWSNPEEKQEIKNALNENKKAKEEAIRKKYKTDNIFERTNDDSKNVSAQIQEVNNQDNPILPIDYNSLPWYKKIFNSVRNIIIKILKK